MIASIMESQQNYKQHQQQQQQQHQQQQQQQQQQHHQYQNFIARFQGWWNDQIMEYFTKANLFIICCIVAALLLIAYLAAFSCEVSWLLEAKGELPTASYLLCAGYFIMFVASTILIHGLVTGLSWGLFSWSVIIGLLSIPELAFVMIMTTQHWGLQSTHGLTELISYLIRLIINCLALLCVIPTALKWRREAQVLAQLQMLARRLQHQTPPPSAPVSKCESHRNSGRRQRRFSKTSTPNAFDNPGFLVNENDISTSARTMLIGPHNEFNANGFGLNPSQYLEFYNIPTQALNAKKAQSLMDLRNTYISVCPSANKNQTETSSSKDQSAIQFHNNFEQFKNNNNNSVNDEKKKNIEDLSTIDDCDDADTTNPNDPIYCTIDNKSPKLSRNCISLENLEGITKIKNDLSYGNNLLQNYHYWCNMYGIGNGFGGYSPTTLIQFQNQFYQQQYPYGRHHYHHQQQQQKSHQFYPFDQSQQYRYHYQYPPSLHYYNNYPPFHPLIGSGGIGYGGFTNPYANKSNTNSKQSIGTDSDDYRKYRDVAL